MGVTTTTTVTKRIPQDEISKAVKTETDDWYDKLVNEAPYVDGMENPQVPLEEISWLELDRVQRGIDFFHEYSALFLCTAGMTAAVVVTAVKRMSTVVFQTNKPIDPHLQFRRFFGKLMGAKKMFTVLLNPEHARKHFYKIRKLHAKVQQRIPNIGKGTPLPELLVWKEEPWMKELVHAFKSDLRQIETKSDDENKCLPLLTWKGSTKGAVSQFDMIFVVTGLIGPVWLMSEIYGMENGKGDEKMKDFIHVLAVMARLLGLKDEFNVFIKPQKHVIDRIVKDVFVASMANMDTCVAFLGDLTMTGIQKRFLLITHKAALLLALRAFGCSRRGNLWRIMSFRDKATFLCFEALVWLNGNIKCFRMLANCLFAIWASNVHRENLEEARKQ